MLTQKARLSIPRCAGVAWSFGVQPRGRTGRARGGLAMAAREAAEAMGRGLRQSVSASGGHVPVKAARELHDRLMNPGDALPDM